jgi:hypothetical protein
VELALALADGVTMAGVPMHVGWKAAVLEESEQVKVTGLAK